MPEKAGGAGTNGANGAAGGATFRLRKDAPTTSRELDIGLGVKLRVRYDMAAVWDISRTLFGRWRTMGEEERCTEVLRLAAAYTIGWNVVGDDEQPVPFGSDALSALFNQEPGFGLAFCSELIALAYDTNLLEKKVLESSPNGTGGTSTVDSAPDAQQPDSHAQMDSQDPTEGSAPT